MFDILSMEFSFGMMDADTLHSFVGLGAITEDQYDEIAKVTQTNSAQSMTSAQASSASAQVQNSASANSATSASTQPTNIQQ